MTGHQLHWGVDSVLASGRWSTLAGSDRIPTRSLVKFRSLPGFLLAQALPGAMQPPSAAFTTATLRSGRLDAPRAWPLTSSPGRGSRVCHGLAVRPTGEVGGTDSACAAHGDGPAARQPWCRVRPTTGVATPPMPHYPGKREPSCPAAHLTHRNHFGLTRAKRTQPSPLVCYAPHGGLPLGAKSAQCQCPTGPHPCRRAVCCCSKSESVC